MNKIEIRPVNPRKFTGRIVMVCVYRCQLSHLTHTKARPSLFAHNHALWRACHAFVDVVDEHVEQARHRFLAAPSHVWRDD